MFSAVLVGMVGIYGNHSLGLISLSIKSTNIGAIAVGGTLFGLAGWLSASTEAYPVLSDIVLKFGDYGKITSPQVLNINEWMIIAAGLTMFAWFEKRDL